jgi:hypothetical protein
MGFEMLTLAILPIFVVALCTLLPQIEFRNNTWKQLHASPQTKANVFIAKYLQVHMLILLLMVSFNVFMAVAIVVAHFISPALNLLNKPFNTSAWVAFNVNAYVAILAISAIQFWLGLRSKNFIIPIAIGFAMWLTDTMMLIAFQVSNADLFPYTYPAFSEISEHKLKLNTIHLYSAGFAALFLILGFMHFKHKNVKV